mmetsp:Transcript_139655/g.246860  ORF Transcript_139655/g.246860 Transcript_139655/m.246860 type:complete len:255 (+) Transcript_139655:61-825(+)
MASVTYVQAPIQGQTGSKIHDPNFREVYEVARQQSENGDPQAIERWYDEIGSTFFPSLPSGCTCAARHAVKLLTEGLAETSKPLRVLDAGCCTGGMGKLLRQHAPTWHLVGSDISHVCLKQASLVFDQVVQSQLPELSLSDADFDVVICVGTICWGHAPPSSISSLARVLKPGGILITGHHINDYERSGWGLPEAYQALKQMTLISKERGPYYKDGDPNDDTGIFMIYRKKEPRALDRPAGCVMHVLQKVCPCI